LQAKAIAKGTWRKQQKDKVNIKEVDVAEEEALILKKHRRTLMNEQRRREEDQINRELKQAHVFQELDFSDSEASDSQQGERDREDADSLHSEHDQADEPGASSQDEEGNEGGPSRSKLRLGTGSSHGFTSYRKSLLLAESKTTSVLDLQDETSMHLLNRFRSITPATELPRTSSGDLSRPGSSTDFRGFFENFAPKSLGSSGVTPAEGMHTRTLKRKCSSFLGQSASAAARKAEDSESRGTGMSKQRSAAASSHSSVVVFRSERRPASTSSNLESKEANPHPVAESPATANSGSSSNLFGVLFGRHASSAQTLDQSMDAS